MGVESFYVKMKCIQIDDIQAVIEKYHNCLDFSIDNDYFCVSGALVSFFSATKLIYNICCRIKERPLFINSLNQFHNLTQVYAFTVPWVRFFISFTHKNS